MNLLQKYFTGREIALWSCYTFLIVISFYIFGQDNYTILLASLVCVTSLLLNAKGNPLGKIFMVIFLFTYTKKLYKNF